MGSSPEDLIKKYGVPESAKREHRIYRELRDEDWQHSDYIDAWNSWLEREVREIESMEDGGHKLSRLEEFIRGLQIGMDNLHWAPQHLHVSPKTAQRIMDRRRAVENMLRDASIKLREQAEDLRIDVAEQPKGVLEEIRDISKQAGNTNRWLFWLTTACAIGAVAQVISCIMQACAE